MKKGDPLGKRNYYRLKATYLVNYRPQGDKGSIGNYNYALTKDIGAGGLLIMSEKNFSKGTVMEMIISLPMYPGKRLKAIGEVISDFPADVYKPLYPTRIRFVEFNNEAFNKLKAFIEEQMNKENKKRIDRRQE